MHVRLRQPFAALVANAVAVYASAAVTKAEFLQLRPLPLFEVSQSSRSDAVAVC